MFTFKNISISLRYLLLVTCYCYLLLVTWYLLLKCVWICLDLPLSFGIAWTSWLWRYDPSCEWMQSLNEFSGGASLRTVLWCLACFAWKVPRSSAQSPTAIKCSEAQLWSTPLLPSLTGAVAVCSQVIVSGFDSREAQPERILEPL